MTKRTTIKEELVTALKERSFITRIAAIFLLAGTLVLMHFDLAPVSDAEHQQILAGFLGLMLFIFILHVLGELLSRLYLTRRITKSGK
jgi:hypothetical protein